MKNNKELDFAADIAQKAGEILKKYFGKKHTKKAKSFPGDFATEADLESEQLIIDAIEAAYPLDSIVAEESGKHDKANSEYTWIVDPLDGTHNFAKHNEGFGVFIARAKGEDIVLAVAYDPISNILATAGKGQGIFLNGEKIILSQNGDETLPLSANQELHSKLKSIGVGDISTSAISPLLDTLMGKRRAYIVNVGFTWDFVVPALSLSEAGWIVTNFRGTEYAWDGKIEFGHPGIVAAPQELHTRILDALHHSIK